MKIYLSQRHTRSIVPEVKEGPRLLRCFRKRAGSDRLVEMASLNSQLDSDILNCDGQQWSAKSKCFLEKKRKK